MKLLPSFILGKEFRKKRFKIIISGSVLGLECPVCTLEWDHTGKPIGDGDERCLNMDGDLAEMSQECTGNGLIPQFTCETRLNSVWDREGEMTFRLRRNCNSYSTAL